MFGGAAEEQLVEHAAALARGRAAGSGCPPRRGPGRSACRTRGRARSCPFLAAISISTAVLLMSEYVTLTPSLMSPRLPQRPGPIRMNCRFGSSLFSRPTARPDVLQVVEAVQPVVLLGVDVDDVRDVGDAAVRDVLAGGEDHAFVGQVARDGRRDRVAREALRPALQQVEVAAVRGELDVHRRADALAQQLEHARASAP